jgi:hypothetical protein
LKNVQERIFKTKELKGSKKNIENYISIISGHQNNIESQMISLQQKLQVEKEYHFCAYNFTGKRGLDGTIPILYNSCKNDKKYENQFNPDILNKYER